MLEKVTGVLSSAKEKKNIENNLSENTGHGKDREVTEGQISFFRNCSQGRQSECARECERSFVPMWPCDKLVACPGCQPQFSCLQFTPLQPATT